MTKQIKSAAANCLQFAKQLASVITSVTIFGLGAYGIYLGRAKISLALGAVALIFAGALTIIVAGGIMYKTLMHKEG